MEQDHEIEAMIWLNYPPVAYDDNATTLRNTAVEIEVLANDKATSTALDPESIALIEKKKRKIELVSQDKGIWEVDSDNGIVRFSPDDGFLGDVEAYYRVDELGGDRSNVAKISVEVVEKIVPSTEESKPQTICPSTCKEECIPGCVSCCTTVCSKEEIILSRPKDENSSNGIPKEENQARKSRGDAMSLWGVILMGMLMILWVRREIENEERRGA